MFGVGFRCSSLLKEKSLAYGDEWDKKSSTILLKIEQHHNSVDQHLLEKEEDIICNEDRGIWVLSVNCTFFKKLSRALISFKCLLEEEESIACDQDHESVAANVASTIAKD